MTADKLAAAPVYSWAQFT